MSDLPPGVTRYARRTGWQLRRFLPAVDVPITLVTLGLGIGVPLLQGADPVTVAVLALLGVLFPPLLVLVPWGAARIVLYVVVLVGAVSWAGDRGLEGGAVYTWLICFLTGGTLLLFLLAEQAFRRRSATAEGAPASGHDPAQGRDVGVLARWQDGEHEYEVVDPDVDVVLAAVRSLDGAQTDVVSLWRGAGRLDVGGDAAGAMIVQQSDTRTAWFQLEDPREEPLADAGAARRAPRLTIRWASTDLPYPKRRLTHLADAETAVRTWIARGERDGSLVWWQDTRWDAALRPRSLKATD